MAEDKKNVSRRDFLKTTGIATGTLVGGGIIGGLIGYNTAEPKKVKVKNTGIGGTQGTGEGTQNVLNRGRMFFTNPTEFEVLSQATERIFPEDDLGPGAIGLGAPYFIDNQLASAYGNNSREYMQGPFYPGAPTQGYQSSLTRAGMFKVGIAKLEEEAQSRFKKGFADLDGGQMDEILTAFQKGEVTIPGTTSALFFKLLRQATLEGAYADPIYNGNNNMDGWRMKGFPGHQMAYINDIEKDEYMKIEPKSLSSMDH